MEKSKADEDPAVACIEETEIDILVMNKPKVRLQERMEGEWWGRILSERKPDIILVREVRRHRCVGSLKKDVCALCWWNIEAAGRIKLAQGIDICKSIYLMRPSEFGEPWV